MQKFLDDNKRKQTMGILAVGGTRTPAAQPIGRHPRTIDNEAQAEQDFAEGINQAETCPEQEKDRFTIEFNGPKSDFNRPKFDVNATENTCKFDPNERLFTPPSTRQIVPSFDAVGRSAQSSPRNHGIHDAKTQENARGEKSHVPFGDSSWTTPQRAATVKAERLRRSDK